ncbi:MAG: DUF1553 domain-containing protein [Opitutales bacterium]
MLKENCFRCHGEEKRKGGLVLTSRVTALKGGESGKVIDLEKPGESLLLELVQENGDPRMPPKKQLTEEEIEAVRKWLTEGAEWDEEILAELPERKVEKWWELPKGFHPVGALATSPDGKQLAVGRGKVVEVFVLSEKDANRTGILKGHRDEVRSVAWSPDGKNVASGEFGRVLVWNAENGKRERVLEEGFSGRVSAMTFAGEKGEWLVAADGEPTVAGRLVVFDTKTWKRMKTVRAHDDSIYGLTTSPDGKLVASAGADKLAKLWKVGSWESAGTLEGHTEYVLAAAFAPDGERIATAGAGASVKAWKVKTRKEFSTFSGRGAKLAKTGLRWRLNPAKEKPEKDDDWIVTVGADGAPRVFSALVEHEGAQTSTGAKERAWSGGEAGLTSVAFSTATKQVVTGNWEGVTTFRDLNGKVVRELEPKADANETKPKEAGNSISFRNDVLPILARAGCASGSCHAKAGGQNGFQLSIFSFDPKSDHREIARDARGRRITPAAPEASLLLRKPTQAIDHEGGKRFEKDSEFYKVLHKWIAQGAPYSAPEEPSLESIAATPASGRYKKGQKIRLKITAGYSDDSKRDVTHLAEYQSNDEGMGTVDEDGLVTLGEQSGEGIVIVRYADEVAVVRVTVPVDKLLPTDAYAGLPVHNEIDKHVYARHKQLGLLVSERCTDAEYIRRASLDAVGKLPDIAMVREFLANKDPKKREKLVDQLLTAPEWADYWATKFVDLLRPNTQRVGVKPVYLIDRWIRRRLRENVSYDSFVRELLTAEGSSHDYGPIAIWRHKRQPAGMGAYVSRIFLGVRLECAQCHHHPNEKWGQDDYYQMAAFFGSMKRKGQGISAPISGEPEYWWIQPGGQVKHPVTGEVMAYKPPDGPVTEVAGETDPREALLNWMLAPENLFFSQAIANRIWGEFFGKGIVHPVDDFRASNPPTNGPLLEWLAKDFAAHGHDLKHLMRRILNSRVYQASSLPNETNARDERNFARSLRRRLPAEVMADAMTVATGTPEHFQGVPGGDSATTVWNTTVSSLFLDVFGRPNPSAEAPCERDPAPTIAQSLHFMNSDQIQTRIGSESRRADNLAKSDKTLEEILEEIYLSVYSRFPSAEESEIALGAFSIEGASKKTAVEDIIWALINTAEFVLNH